MNDRCGICGDPAEDFEDGEVRPLPLCSRCDQEVFAGHLSMAVDE